jgi:hypothetical protein
MNAHRPDSEIRAAWGEVPPEELGSPIPGDPFAWEPDSRRKRLPRNRRKKFGFSTPSPADPADLDSYDLGGGD